MSEDHQAKIEALTAALDIALKKIEDLEKTQPSATEDRNGASSPETGRQTPNAHIRHEAVRDVEQINDSNANDIIRFIISIDAIFNIFKAEDKAFVEELYLKCRGQFAHWWARTLARVKNWPEMKSLILEEYFNPLLIETIVSEEVNRFQRPDETLRQFILSIESTAQALNLDIPEPRLINIILSHINPATFGLLRYGDPPTTLHRLLQLAGDVDGAVQRQIQYGRLMGSQAAAFPPPREQSSNAGVSARPWERSTDPRSTARPLATCHRCGLIGHPSERCTGKK
jgi:hypothetical protein